MKIRLKPGTVAKLEKDMREKARSIAKDKDLLGEIADVIIEDIKYQTRRGVSNVTGITFERLTNSWKEQRAKLAKVNTTHPAYKKNKSNLTLTGQLLDSMRKRFIDEYVVIEFQGDHQPYKRPTSERGSTGKSKGAHDKLKNADLARYVAEKRRPFFAAREKILEQLKKIVIKHIRRKL